MPLIVKDYRPGETAKGDQGPAGFQGPKGDKGDAGSQMEIITLTSTNITEKKVKLSILPPIPSSVSLFPSGGIHQLNGVDFQVFEDEVRWEGLGLDNFLELNDIIVVQC